MPKEDWIKNTIKTIFSQANLWPWEDGEIVSILESRIDSLSAYERVELATAYFALGRVPSGQQQWEKAIASSSNVDTALSHFNLGEELRKTGALDGALLHLRRAYELDPQNSTFRMEYNTVRERLGR